MSELDEIDGWKEADPGDCERISDEGELWVRIDDPESELFVDQSRSDEPREWKVILPDGRQRFSRSRPVIVALAELYMKTGSL